MFWDLLVRAVERPEKFPKKFDRRNFKFRTKNVEEKIMKKIFVGILMLTFLSATVFARPVKRIKFAKGATEIVVAGQLRDFKDSQVYLINLRAGQTFTIEDVGDNPVTISVFEPGGKNVDDYDASCHGNFSLPKTKKGDYRIIVTECKKADPWKGVFKIKVSATDN